MAADVGLAGVILDVAPSQFTTRLLQRLGARRVIGMDFDPDADRRHVDIQASLTDVPLPDASVDLMICYHVLEHIPDDRRAMSEIARVLSPGGTGLLQVPWRPGTVTDEDPEADEATRLARFGQADHVRFYGSDFEDRLVEAGLSVLRVAPRDYLSEDLCRAFHVVPDDTVWCVRPASPTRPAGVRSSGDQKLAAVRDPRVPALTKEARRLSRRLHQTQAAYDRLRGRLPIRIAARMRKAVKRVTNR